MNWYVNTLVSLFCGFLLLLKKKEKRQFSSAMSMDGQPSFTYVAQTSWLWAQCKAHLWTKVPKPLLSRYTVPLLIHSYHQLVKFSPVLRMEASSLQAVVQFPHLFKSPRLFLPHSSFVCWYLIVWHPKSNHACFWIIGISME